MAVTFEIDDAVQGAFGFAGDTGFIMLKGYMPAVATPTGDGSIPPNVTEIIPVVIKGTSHDNFALNMQFFHAWQRRVALYRTDPTYVEPVFLVCKTDDETGTRRALIYSLSVEFNNKLSGLYDELPLLKEGREATVIIERHPYWESTTSRVFPEDTAVTIVSTVAGAYDYTAAGNGGTPAARNIQGDVAARVGTIAFEFGLANTQIERLWIGLRSANKHPTLANFINMWECEQGTNNALESGITDEALAGASGGGFVEVTEVDLDWDGSTNGNIFQKVLDISLSQMTANESSNYGDYLWILRMLVDSGTWLVRLLHGYAGQDSTDWVIGPVVEVTSTTFEMYEMGARTIPLRNLRAVTDTASGATDTFEGANAIRIQAKRTSGAGDLNVDVLIPIPIDEGWLKASNFRIKDGVTAEEILWIGESPEGDWWGGSTADAATVVWDRIAVIEDHNFRLPPGDGRMMITHAKASDSDRDNGLAISRLDTGAYWERWLSLRGAQ